jgi:hypothetical protein
MAIGLLLNFLAVPTLTKYIQSKLTYVSDSSAWKPLTYLPSVTALLLNASGLLAIMIGLILILFKENRK